MTEPKAKTPKAKAPKRWRATVNLDRLDAATGQWRITTGSASDPLPRAVATHPEVRASVVAWMTAHGARSKPAPEATAELEAAIRTNVITAFRALPPAAEAETPAAPTRKS
jgi:hypothetical protein